MGRGRRHLGDEISVAAGTYHPDEGAGITPGNQTVSFQLDKGLKLYGGFIGSSLPFISSVTDSYLVGPGFENGCGSGFFCVDG